MAVLLTKTVEKLLKEGKKVPEIAEKYGITTQGVYYHIDKLKKEKLPEAQYPDKSLERKNFIMDWEIYNEGLVQ